MECCFQGSCVNAQQKLLGKNDCATWGAILKALEVCALILQYNMFFCLKSLGICKLVPQNHDLSPS